MPIDIMEQMRGAFRTEALDLLIELDSALLALEERPRAIPPGKPGVPGHSYHQRIGRNRRFRAPRRGSLTRWKRPLTWRGKGDWRSTPELIDCGLKACDVFALIIEENAEGAAVPGEVEVTGAFTRLLPPSVGTAPRSESLQAKPAAEVRRAFEIIFKPNREMFYSGADPVTLLDDLRELGQAHITAHIDQVPPLPSIEAEHCYLWWEILLVTTAIRPPSRRSSFSSRTNAKYSSGCWKIKAGLWPCSVPCQPRRSSCSSLECEDHLEGIERDALALEKDSDVEEQPRLSFSWVHSIKGNAGLLLGHVTWRPHLRLRILCNCCLRGPWTGVLLDPFRGVDSAPWCRTKPSKPHWRPATRSARSWAA